MTSFKRVPPGQLGTVRFLGDRDAEVLVDGKIDQWARGKFQNGYPDRHELTYLTPVTA